MKKNKPIIAILCGGKGLRLRPITSDIPKPLVKIDNRPILEYIVNHFKDYKYSKYVIATGYKSKQVEKFMHDKFYSLDYKIINSGNVEIIQRIRDIIDNAVNTDIILCYGDTISDVNLNKLEKFHYQDLNSITVTSYPINIPFGVMNIDKNSIVESFVEKPVLDDVMNIGYFYISQSLFKNFYKYNSFKDVLVNLANKKQLKCYQHKGIHITVNTITELEHANENIKKISK